MGNALQTLNVLHAPIPIGHGRGWHETAEPARLIRIATATGNSLSPSPCA